VNLTINISDLRAVASGRSSTSYINSLSEDFKECIEHVDPFTSDRDFFTCL